MSHYDVIIIGGGPGGLSAALALGRARRRILVCDGGPRRNAAATHIHNFVTRDGTPPDEFRRIAREQLARYPGVELRDARVGVVRGSTGAFELEVGDHAVCARRIILATGMFDEPLPIPGFAELWGTSIFQCPYCHGFEIKAQHWGILAVPTSVKHIVPFALQALAWTRDVTLYTNAAIELSADARAQFEARGIGVQTRAIARLSTRDGVLAAIELDSGERTPCDALFAHPPQRHVELVQSLNLELDDEGYVKVDPMRRETSVPGIFAAGDVASRMQGALLAAASGMQTAAMVNVDIAMSM